MKSIKILFVICIAFLLTSCKKTSPEAQAVIDSIKAVAENSEHTYTELTDIQAQFDALTEEQQEEVTNFGEYKESVEAFFNEKKEEVKTALSGKKYYFSEKEASVGVMKFSSDQIQISLYQFDGNGKSETASVNYEYVCDGSVITLTSGSAPMEIAYTIKDGNATLDSYYMTEEQVIDGLQGNWVCKTSYFGKGNEYNMSISGTKAKYESAAEAFGYNDGSYYYYGPYSGSFVIDDGSVSIDAMHGKEFFFSCYNGKVQLYHYDNKMSAGSGLKGEDGYENSF